MKKSSIVRDAKHTPGPWKWDEGWGAILSCGDVQRLVCSVWAGENRSGMTESEVARNVADARLIAAAPDLLAALHLIADAHHYSGMTYCQDVARDAIAKATIHD